ncbi:MAG: STAS domain-containing protein [Rhodocyclaceae bacterium]|nr:STAS domain-containing protein [Rhodocyclaceae bacterium]
MDASVHSNDDAAVIRLAGRFDFNSHREFRDAVEKSLDGAVAKPIRVELGGVTYLDSSALGMLLMLRDKAKAANRAVSLSGAQGNVKQVLDIANFGKLFSIS